MVLSQALCRNVNRLYLYPTTTQRCRIMSRTGKYLSRILRHEPEAIDLSLRPGGGLPIDELLRALKRAGYPLTREKLEVVVASNDKQRFTTSQDGRRIRAAQGHSIKVNWVCQQ